MTTDGSSTTAIRRLAGRTGPIRWLVAGGVTLIAAVALATTIVANNFRESALNSAGRELENTVLLLARHFDQQLEDLTAIQKDMAAFVMISDIVSPARFKQKMSGQ